MDMDRETQVAEDTTAPAVDRAEEPAAVAVRAARMLANPRRVRRA